MQALSFDETSRTTAAAGFPLHYHEAGDGPALVMLHGAGPGVSAWSNFGANLPVYAKSFHTYLLDLPGFGRTGHPEAYDKDYLTYASDVLVDFLDDRGLDQVHLIGNSLGGSVAVRFVLDHPDRARRIVLMGPGSALSIGLFAPRPSEGIRNLLAFQKDKSRDRMETFLRGMVFDQSLITEELIDERLAAAVDPATGAGLAAMQKANQNPAFHERGELWREASLVEHEVLITWGREDRTQPLDGAFVGFRLLPNARLHVFPKCGHWAMVERKDEFERLTTDFLLAH